MPAPVCRRIRNGLSLTQTAMAEALGISPSYLNLIERNQRPLTVQLLLKLASVYKVDLDELQGEASGSVAQLREMFADPLLAGELPGDQELIEVAEAAPNVATGILKLYRAYREQASRLADLSGLLAGEGHDRGAVGCAAADGRSARGTSRVVRTISRAIEEAAEAFHARLSPGDDLAGALKDWLRKEHGLTVRASAGACHARSAPPFRPPFDAAFPVGAAVRARSAARDRHGGCADRLAAKRSPPTWINSAFSTRRGAAHRPFRACALCRACADDALRRISSRQRSGRDTT